MTLIKLKIAKKICFTSSNDLYYEFLYNLYIYFVDVNLIVFDLDIDRCLKKIEISILLYSKIYYKYKIYYYKYC